MKCRIQIRLTESNYWEKKIASSLGKKYQNRDTDYTNVLSTSLHLYKLSPLLVLSLSFYYAPFFFISHWTKGLK